MCVSVCRCMCVKIVATLLQNPKFIIYTWKTTILLVRLFTNSMTRGISSSQMQILLTCYSRLILKKKITIPWSVSVAKISSSSRFEKIGRRACLYYLLTFFWQYKATLWAPIFLHEIKSAIQISITPWHYPPLFWRKKILAIPAL